MKKIRWSWKLAFFCLVGINILVFVLLFILMVLPTSDGIIPNKQELTTENVSLNIQSSKADLNRLINYYIEKEETDSDNGGSIDYQVQLTDEVELYVTIPVFSESIETKLTFLPKALKNGDLLLTQESVSIGQLHLPVTYIMNFLKKTYHFPEWVEIFPNEKTIYIHLTDLEIQNNMEIRANEFDLEKDNISFSLIVNPK
ncbi:YpmS family protein [Caldibacillus lycopersici]|uniref:YpmS family protein n=1 Tax=Perspicuibacillus lycopersici TaxID=1325689 RepID=A0AAE3LN68_9BACI|nr:YpmS family protein [Perspicuibacillus lycopersici]MCU9613631.1 YpmS family protein [Perspicuibacillus lycopersici]